MHSSSDTKTIVVVDPCEDICELLQVILVRFGYHIHAATNAADAMRLAHDTPRIDLLLSDINIPDMRGDYLAAEISMLHPQVSVIFSADWLDPMEVKVPFTLLRKPFTTEQLRAVVHCALLARPASVGMAHAA
jgi:DNA-binding NtrC family response regulator